jgi:hypothetical protein
MPSKSSPPGSVNSYLHADMALKEKAIARTAPPDTPAGRYQPPDEGQLVSIVVGGHGLWVPRRLIRAYQRGLITPGR